MRGRVLYNRDGTTKACFVDGKEVSREEFDRIFAPKEGYLDEPPAGPSPSGWPMLSDALAVHPKQIQEVMDRNARHGLHVEYNTEDGRALLADRGQRRDLMRLEGFHDNEGGYGDDHP